MTITELVQNAHAQAKKSGWWPEGEAVNVPEKLALIHSEVSECLEKMAFNATRSFRQGASMRETWVPTEDGDPEAFWCPYSPTGLARIVRPAVTAPISPSNDAPATDEPEGRKTALEAK